MESVIDETKTDYIKYLYLIYQSYLVRTFPNVNSSHLEISDTHGF